MSEDVKELAESIERYRVRYAEEKPKWGEGPWQNEADRVEFERAGLPCILARHPESGHWCGYVGLPPNHPLFGVDGGDYDNELMNGLDVHGGVTYASPCQGQVCHVPKPGEDDRRWWLGWDFNHSDDVAPRMIELGRTRGYPWGPLGYGATYKDVQYVRHETEHAADQLAAMVMVRP